jgi:hypothetical protein
LSIIAIENETTIKNILNKIIDEYLERSRKWKILTNCRI